MSIKPFDFLEVGLNDKYWTDNSFLPIWGYSLNASAMGTDGLTLLVKKSDFRFAITAPFDEYGNWFGTKKYTDSHYVWNGGSVEDESDVQIFDVGFGVEYTFHFDDNYLSVSATVKDTLDNDQRRFGFFTSTLFNGLMLNFGFVVSQEYDKEIIDRIDLSKSINLLSEYLLTAGFCYDFGIFNLNADFATNFGEEYEDPYDLYFAMEFLRPISEFTIKLKGIFLFDLKGEKLDPVVGVEPSLVYQKGRHQVSIGFDWEMVDNERYLGIPIKWKYSF